ncbi:MAG: hypothetical protein ABL889_19985 [Terricaulis sp.]
MTGQPQSPFTPAQMEPEDALARRIEGIAAWLEEQMPACFDEQAHTREGTRERVYWHYGYMVALRDMQRLLAKAQSAPRN